MDDREAFLRLSGLCLDLGKTQDKVMNILLTGEPESEYNEILEYFDRTAESTGPSYEDYMDRLIKTYKKYFNRIKELFKNLYPDLDYGMGLNELPEEVLKYIVEKEHDSKRRGNDLGSDKY